MMKVHYLFRKCFKKTRICRCFNVYNWIPIFIFFLALYSFLLLQIPHSSLKGRMEIKKVLLEKRSTAINKPINETLRVIREDYDERNRYVILRNMFVADVEPELNDVTLLTQCDTGKLDYIIEIAERWQGPIHVSLYSVTTSLESRVIGIINELRLCYDNIRHHVTWHLTSPVSNKVRIISVEFQKTIVMVRLRRSHEVYVRLDADKYKEEHPNCRTTLSEDISELRNISVGMDPDARNKNGSYIAYFPMNVLANIARTESKTEFVFFIDGDLVPSIGIREQFLDFAARKNLFGDSDPNGAEATSPVSLVGISKAGGHNLMYYINLTQPVCGAHNPGEPFPGDIYVVPTFQFNGKTEIPRDIMELQIAHRIGTARKYYEGIFFHPYGPTGHSFWMNMKRGLELDCLYTVKYHMNYEPYYISRRTIPLYDERFAGHGNVKVSQLAAVAAAGYKFKVLNNVFLIHRGWKERVEEERTLKVQEYRSQLKTWEKFLNELEEKYNNNEL